MKINTKITITKIIDQSISELSFSFLMSLSEESSTPSSSPPERGLGSVSIALGILTQWLKLLQSLVVSSSGQKGELHIVHT